ncbi:DB module [Teladorsagia circumcincta]|uniref:DB module n=1 Tax=Teladorsagia circumcincta TaxID=45464 RepID=A0A2G9UV66_TELCI|nr:DB module [Teladorsagia circumcincta]
MTHLVKEKRCSIRYLSSILYCASQNRDNRKCCEDLDLNATQLQVGSRCLRMCDPSGTAVERMTKEDITCLYNWNVIMYCHHAGIREM